MPLTPEDRRLLNSWNAARHGWDRFQAGSRRATLRMARKPLRVVSNNEAAPTPKSLLEAVESGTVLEMLKAQRRLIADALVNPLQGEVCPE